jgi:16S rRNA (cytidine1402-2'-O)-methyltransferase
VTDGDRRDGALVLVATPIGNLGDLSPRAVATMAAAALVCAEDSRRVAKLFAHAGIAKVPVVVTNEHTELSRIPTVLATLADGGDVVLVSDAGTPGVSDPGHRLVSAVLDAGYAVSIVPGPVAAVSALVISGLPSARFVVEGFLPRSGRVRARRLDELAAERRTTVLYEAPHRIVRTLEDLTAVCGPDRPVTIVRELTKRFEEVVRSTLGSIDIGEPRGEYVVVLGGAPDEPPDDETIREAVRFQLDAGAGTNDAASTVAKALGIPKRLAYSIALGTLRSDHD